MIPELVLVYIKKKEIDWAVPIIKETLKEIEEEHIR
mgnify:CR=1 FL=1